MDIVWSILTIAIAVVVYIYTIELFTILFRITGLTKEKAKFQVISLITCSGFTTSEAEIVTVNKRRRRLAVVCMITGTIFNVIIISFLLNLINSVATSGIMNDQISKVVIILSIAVGIIIISKLPFVSKPMEKLVMFLAKKVFYRSKKTNILTLLDSYGKEAIVQVTLNKTPEVLCNKTLVESDLKKRYNINLMMLKRGNRTLEITGNTVIQDNDEIVVFGNRQAIKDLFSYKITEEYDEEIHNNNKENELTLIDNYGEDAMAEVVINDLPEILVDKKLYESEIKTKYNLNILTVVRDDISLSVTKDTIIQQYDTVVIFGNYNNIKKVFNII